jgi:hypothetical protein
MYEEASKYETTMATGFALLSMDKNIEPLHHWDHKWNGGYKSNQNSKINGREGLIIRKKNPDDGRGVLIYLTELGKKKRLIKKYCFKIQ